MTTSSQRPKERESALSLLNAAIDAINLANGASTIAPIKNAFGSARDLLTMIRVGLIRFTLVRCRLMYTGLNGQQDRLH